VPYLFVATVGGAPKPPHDPHSPTHGLANALRPPWLAGGPTPGRWSPTYVTKASTGLPTIALGQNPLHQLMAANPESAP